MGHPCSVPHEAPSSTRPRDCVPPTPATPAQRANPGPLSVPRASPASAIHRPWGFLPTARPAVLGAGGYTARPRADSSSSAGGTAPKPFPVHQALQLRPLPRALSAPGKAADPESAEDRAGEPAWPCRGAQDTAGSPAATPRTLCYLLGAQPSAPGPALLAEGLISRRPGRLVLRLTELPGPAQSARPSLYRQPCEAARRPKAGLVATRGTRSLWAPATDLPFGPHLSRSP